MKSHKGGSTMKRTIVVAVLLGMFLSTGIASCGPTQKPTEVEVTQEALPTATLVPAVPEDKVVLEIMTWSENLVELYEDAAREFEQEYPNIELEFITMPENEYYEARPLLFESGQAPDIFYQSGGAQILSDFLEKGWIRPLHPDGTAPQEWMERWPDGYFIPGINVYDNEVYSFHHDHTKIGGWGLMFYNKEILAEAGLDPEHPPETWSELKDACRTISSQSVSAGIAISLYPPADIRRLWMAIAGSIMTDKTFDYQQGRFCMDDERMLAAYEYIRGFYDEALVLRGDDPENPYPYDKEFARQALATGQAAFYFDGSWIPSYLKTIGFEDFVNTNLGIAATPYPDNRPRGALSSLLNATSFWVSSQTQHPEEAWLFIDWMTQPDGFYGREYVSRGLGFLQYVDNAQYVTDPSMLRVIEIAPALRVIYPEPLVLNPELAESQAYLTAGGSVKWMPTVGECLLNDCDFNETAQDAAQTQNDLFIQTLEEERNSGLDVSVDDYTFPDWNLNEDFDYESYQKDAP